MRALLAALLALFLLRPAAAEEPPLVADLSDHLVAITTGFAGTEVLLFGAIEGEGEVVVVVRGPLGTEVVRRKGRMLGLWVNTAEAAIEGAPSFYWVAASAPLAEIAPASVLERHQIGFDQLRLDIRPQPGGPVTPFRAALLRLKQQKGLYAAKLQPVSFLGQRLFRTRLHLPANVPVGTYSVEVYLLRDGEVASAQTTPLIISKVGVGAEVYDFAHNRAPLYGIVAILLAIGSGWLAAIAFKKG